MDNEKKRNTWLEKVLRSLPSGQRILDAGAGTQPYKRFCDHLRYVSQDFAAYDGKGDATALQTGAFDYGKLDIISDIAAIPEPDSSFDVVMCSEVLEHVPDPLRVLAEFRRLLRSGGTLILTAPFCSLTHFAPFHFSTGFSKYWYQEHLKSVGFVIQAIEPNGNYFEYLAQEIHRTGYIASRYAKAKPRLYEKVAAYVLSRMLLRFTRKDSGSAELLCFGYHVLASKP